MDSAAGLGLLPAIYAGFAVAVLVYAASLVGDFLIGHINSFAGMLAVSLKNLVFGIDAGLAVFCAAFAVLNSILRPGPFGIDWIRADVARGYLPLQIISLLLAVRLIMLCKRFLGTYYLKRPGKASRFSDVTVGDAYRDYVRDSADAAQLGIFLVTLTILWTFIATSANSTLAVVLNFALLFIVDDFIIISDYSNALGGRLLRSHFIRLAVANIALFSGTIVAAFLNLTPLVATAYAVAALLLASRRYQIFFFSKERDVPPLSIRAMVQSRPSD